MTLKYNNVYINDTSVVVGKIENEGPLKNYFDKSYNDFYMGEKTFEQGEKRMILDSINILFNKTNTSEKDIDLIIGGNLTNQLMPLNFALKEFNIPYMGVYSACSTITLSIIIASSLIDKKYIKNAICNVSSNNSSSEKQFRNPTEYGTPKPDTSTFTATGSVCVLLDNKKNKIKIDCATIGSVVDYGIKDANNVGAAMAPSAAKTIYEHLNDTKRTIDYYDIVLTGDLGIYGKEILKDLMEIEYGINLKKYNDCGIMLYDLKTQDVKAGASGPTSSAITTFSYVINEMKKGKYKKVLLVATGALFSQTSVAQKLTIPSISHAISLEVV